MSPHSAEEDPKKMKEIYKSISIDKNKLDEYYNTILSRVEKGDAPGGLVAYAFPDYRPGVEDVGKKDVLAAYTEAFSGRSDKLPFNLFKSATPDTINFFSTAIQEHQKSDNEPKNYLLNTIYHEPIHSVASHGYSGEDNYGYKAYQAATDKMMSDAEKKVGADSLIQMINNLLNPPTIKGTVRY